MFTLIWLTVGLLAGAFYIRFARHHPTKTKSSFAVGLIVASCIYLAFALTTSNIAIWLPIEFLGVCIYGAMGIAGLRGSVWWLVIGWGLHPLWDLVLHYFGPGASVAPSWYTVACVSFDFIVAAYIAYNAEKIGLTRQSR
jgi:hypothetical protein